MTDPESTPGPDPVRFEDDAWYFYDEVWADRYGPYETEEEARNEFFNYCASVGVLPPSPRIKE